jgi:hypothetical protein
LEKKKSKVGKEEKEEQNDTNGIGNFDKPPGKKFIFSQKHEKYILEKMKQV